MTASSTLPAPNLMPLMRYRDLATAMGWLEQAFGFEKHIAVSDNDGDVIYGQMTYHGSLMMMGAVRDTDLDKLMRQPDEVGGVETQSCYLVVDDADAHYARAQDAGAEIVLELKSDGLGRRGYSCRDPEGHIWNFGTYNPGKGLTATFAAAAPAAGEVAEAPRQRRAPRLVMGLAALLLALGTAGWWFADEIGPGLAQRIAAVAGHHSAQEAERAYAELAKVRAEKRKADKAAEAASTALETERARRLALEANSGNAVDKLAAEEHARRAAEAAVETLRAELKRTRDALDAAVEAKRVSEEKLAVKSAAQTVAPKPSADTSVATETPPPAASGIETSATRSTTGESAAKADDDDDDEARPIPRKAASRARAAPKRKSAAAAAARQNKLPSYVVDMKHVWPYDSWSN